MPVKQVAWAHGTDQEVQRLESLMRLGIVIVDLERRRMGDEDIQFAAIADLADQQTQQ